MSTVSGENGDGAWRGLVTIPVLAPYEIGNVKVQDLSVCFKKLSNSGSTVYDSTTDYIPIPPPPSHMRR